MANDRANFNESNATFIEPPRSTIVDAGNNKTSYSEDSSGGLGKTTNYSGLDVQGEPPSGDSANGADKSAQDKYDEVVQKICEGSLSPLIAIPNVPVRSSFNVFGVGNVLSGKYYIASSSLTFSREGISQTIGLRKTEFGGDIRVTDDSRDGRPSPLIPTYREYQRERLGEGNFV